MKEYRILYKDEAVNQNQINELAREGFVIAFVVSGHERHGTVLYMERDTTVAEYNARIHDEIISKDKS